MTDMTIDMHDICGRKGDGQAMIRALMPRPSDGRVVTPEWVKTPIIAGLGAFADVAPGLAEVHVRMGSSFITAANQVAGAGKTDLSVAFAVGDILTVHVTSVGSTPGKGLVADIKAVTEVT